MELKCDKIIFTHEYDMSLELKKRIHKIVKNEIDRLEFKDKYNKMISLKNDEWIIEKSIRGIYAHKPNNSSYYGQYSGNHRYTLHNIRIFGTNSSTNEIIYDNLDYFMSWIHLDSGLVSSNSSYSSGFSKASGILNLILNNILYYSYGINVIKR